MIKSTLSEKEDEDSIIQYPCHMMSDNGNLVLFTKRGVGTLLAKGGHREQIGHHSEEWVMAGFKKYNGRVTTENCDESA